MTRQVAIFRQQLFKVSESFVVQQSEALTRYRGIYCGRVRFGRAPAGATCASLDTVRGLWAALCRTAAPVIRAARPYQAALRRVATAPVCLVHAHFGIDGVQALPLARLLGVPLITTFHGFDATRRVRHFACSSSPSLVNYALHRRELAQHGTLFICVSGYIRDRLLAAGFPPDRVRVHHIGVDTRRITLRAPDEETSTVLHVARLIEGKGTMYLIQAFARIAWRYPNVQLKIVGDGPLRDRLSRLAAACGIASRVTFMGAQAHADVLREMRGAEALVLPSVTASSGDTEGLGMVLLEAAATGVPQIGTMLGGIPEAVKEGSTGYLVPERDVDALADRLARLLDSPELRRNMGAAGRHMAETRFDLKHQSSELEDMYDEVLACHAKR